MAHVTEWAGTNFGLKVEQRFVVRRIDNSQVVVRFDTPVAKAFGPLHKFGELLTAVPNFGNLPLTLSTIAYGSPSGIGGQPLSVSMERRSNTPVDANIFYCQAPLNTDVHLNLLEEFDQLIAQG